VGWKDVLLDLSLYRRKKLDEVFEHINLDEEKIDITVSSRDPKERALEASSE